MKDAYHALAVQHIAELRELADKKGLSDMQLAEITGLQRPTVWRVLHGKFMPKLDTYLRLKAAIEK